MPHPVERLFKVNKDVVDVLLVLAVFFTHISDVEDLFCDASSTAKTNLLFGYRLFCLWFQSVQDDFHHHFARMTNEWQLHLTTIPRDATQRTEDVQ